MPANSIPNAMGWCFLRNSIHPVMPTIKAGRETGNIAKVKLIKKL